MGKDYLGILEMAMGYLGYFLLYYLQISFLLLHFDGLHLLLSNLQIFQFHQ